MKKIIVSTIVIGLLLMSTIVTVDAEIYGDVNKEIYIPNESRPNDWWPMDGHDSERLSYSLSQAPETNNILWMLDLSKYGSHTREIVGDPVIYEGKIYFGTRDLNGTVFCLDELTGEAIWTFNPPGSIVFEDCAAVDYGTVFIPSMPSFFDDNLYALDADDGSLKWSVRLEGQIRRPLVHNKKLYVATPFEFNKGLLYCLDVEDGSTIWKCNLDCTTFCPPCLSNGRVYVGDEGGILYCIDADTGTKLWKYYTNDEIFNSPTAYDGKIYFGNDGGNIYCINAKTKYCIWKFETGDKIVCSPTIAYNRVYVTSKDGKLYCLDAETGQHLWDFTAGMVSWADPTVADGKVYVCSYDKNIYCLNAMSGDLIWMYTIDGYDYINSDPVIANGKMIVCSWYADIYCFKDDVNYPPNIPEEPFGQTPGEPGVNYIYETNTYDPEGNNISYMWDWGDGTYSEWLGPHESGQTANATHTWMSSGRYDVRVRAKDEEGPLSEWSDYLSVNINPPEPPTITGPTSGKVGKEYNYTFVSIDPVGDDIAKYTIDWGDDNIEVVEGLFVSGEEIIVSHIWNIEGTYNIKAKATNIHGAESNWGTLTVTMPKNQQSSQSGPSSQSQSQSNGSTSL